MAIVKKVKTGGGTIKHEVVSPEVTSTESDSESELLAVRLVLGKSYTTVKPSKSYNINEVVIVSLEDYDRLLSYTNENGDNYFEDSDPDLAGGIFIEVSQAIEPDESNDEPESKVNAVELTGDIGVRV